MSEKSELEVLSDLLLQLNVALEVSLESEIQKLNTLTNNQEAILNLVKLMKEREESD